VCTFILQADVQRLRGELRALQQDAQAAHNFYKARILGVKRANAALEQQLTGLCPQLESADWVYMDVTALEGKFRELAADVDSVYEEAISMRARAKTLAAAVAQKKQALCALGEEEVDLVKVLDTRARLLCFVNSPEKQGSRKQVLAASMFAKLEGAGSVSC
jgi:uncharacterized protein (UPF0335 family)